MSFGGEKRPSGNSRFIAPLVIIALNLLLFVGASTPPVQALQGVVQFVRGRRRGSGGGER